MGTALGSSPDLDQRQDPCLQDPRNTATSSAGDDTLYNDHHPARWSCQDTGAISARPRTMPKMTTTPDAIPHSALFTVLDHCTPAIQGEDDDFRDLPVLVHRPSLCL